MLQSCPADSPCNPGGILLLQAYEADNVAPSEAAVQRVLDIISSFPKAGPSEGYEPPVEDCSRLAAAAVKWLRK